MEFVDSLSTVFSHVVDRHHTLSTLPTIPTPTEVQKTISSLPSKLPEKGLGTTDTTVYLLQTLLPGCLQAQNGPRYFGFVIGGVTEAAQLADILASSYDENVSVTLPGVTASTAVEARTLELVLDLLDMPRDTYQGRTITTGATASNVLGLDHLYAHSPHLPEGYSFAQSGPPSGPNLPSPPIILLTLYPHFSLLKASALVGIGSGPNVVHTMPAAPDDELAFDLSALRSRLAEEQAVGRGVIVTYGLGEVNTGGFGRGLDEVAVMCKEYGAWLHLDGAFGGFAGVVPELRGLVKGMDMADSLTLDGHKWLNVPYDCGLFFTRSSSSQTSVFAPTLATAPAYLAAGSSSHQPNGRTEGEVIPELVPAPLYVGIENSRRFRALPLFASLMSLGKQGYEDIVRTNVDFARRIAHYLDTSAHYELINRSPVLSGDLDEKNVHPIIPLNIVLFRGSHISPFPPNDPSSAANLTNAINDTRRMYVTDGPFLPPVSSDPMTSMDTRRRTLAPEGPLGNALPHSSIPVPSSVMKKPATRTLGASRMSMAPSHSQTSLAPAQNTLRLSTMGNGGLGMSHSSSQEGFQRRSTMMPNRGDGGQQGMASASRGDGGTYGRTPQTTRSIPSSARRSSVYTSGRQSLALNAFSSNVAKDTRPIRQSAFQASCVRNISEYLLVQRCPIPLGPKTFTSPTTKDFQSIFRFLVQELVDPGMGWTKKFEDDAINLLKDLRYPAMETIGRTGLGAPGGRDWPPLLAMLNWMVELCKAHDNWFDPEIVSDPLLTPAKDLPIDHPNLEERLLWDFSSKTYKQWFDGGAEEFPEAEQELEEVYDQMAQVSFDDCEKLETEIQKRNVELQQLQAQEPPLKKLEDEYVQLMSDKTKFIAFIELHKQKAEKIKVGNGRARAAITDHETQLEAIHRELAQTEEAVAAQNLSPDEVQRMNHERETLTRNLDELRTKTAEASQMAYDNEMQVTKSMDRFEQYLQDYTALGHQIGVIQPLSEGLILGPGNVDYTIELDLGLEDLNEVQAAGRKMRSVIWPALQAYGEGFRKQQLELANSTIALDDKYDRLGQKVERQKDEVGNLEMRLKFVHEQAEDAKNQLHAETAEANRTVAKLETEVTAMSTASQQGVLTQQSQLESTKIVLKELRHKTALLQDAVVAQLSAQIDVVIKAKEHAANSLKGVRTFAEAQ